MHLYFTDATGTAKKLPTQSTPKTMLTLMDQQQSDQDCTPYEHVRSVCQRLLLVGASGC